MLFYLPTNADRAMDSFSAIVKLSRRFSPHFNNCVLTHNMDFSAIRALARQWEVHSQNQLQGHRGYLEGVSLRDAHFKRALSSNIAEQDHCRAHKPWTNTSRLVLIDEYRDIKNAIGLHGASSIKILPKQIVVHSCYHPKILLRLLQGLFSALERSESIKLRRIDYFEIKVSIPIEFANREALQGISKPLPSTLAPTRLGIASLYFSRPEPGVSAEAYELHARRYITYCPRSGRGEIRTRPIYADKTRNELIRPLEFRFGSEALSRLGLSTKPRDFDRTVDYLRYYTVQTYLLDSADQLKVPILPIPEPWRGADASPRYKPCELRLRPLRRDKGEQVAFIRDEDGHEMPVAVAPIHNEKRGRPIEEPPWNWKSWKNNAPRIQFVDQMLAGDPWTQSLSSEWRRRHLFLFHDDLELEWRQCESAFRTAGVTIADFIPFTKITSEELE